ncbi:hypothetical protein P7C70_g5664, partial [Phenoliferia sp. Uapishka_3]
MYQPEIVPSSPTGQALQASIQKHLAHLGWSTEDDTVMAEYCLVMLGNKKTQDQITSELSDLIGSEFDSSFVLWLFNELHTHYPDPSSAAGPSSTSGNSTSANGVNDGHRSPESDARRYDDRRGSRGSVGQASAGNARGGGRGGPGPIGPIFGAAMSGVKRDAREVSDRELPPHQRARYDRTQGGFDGVPAGPRNMGQQQGVNGGRGAGQVGAGARNTNGGNSIFDRVQTGGNQNFAQQGTPDATLAAANGNGFPQGPAGYVNPQMIAQAQAAAMAQAFAAMQSWASQQGGAGGFPGAPAAFNPAFNPAFRGGAGGPGAFSGAGRGHHHQQGQRPPHQQHQN